MIVKAALLAPLSKCLTPATDLLHLSSNGRQFGNCAFESVKFGESVIYLAPSSPEVHILNNVSSLVRYAQFCPAIIQLMPQGLPAFSSLWFNVILSSTVRLIG